jgi:DNA-directed RNA polymerase subunit M/transcription elongation factor TFIIS
MQLVATCLSCGERWLFAPSPTVGTGVLWLLLRRRKQPDKCPKCGSRAVSFTHPGHANETADAR